MCEIANVRMCTNRYIRTTTTAIMIADTGQCHFVSSLQSHAKILYECVFPRPDCHAEELNKTRKTKLFPRMLSNISKEGIVYWKRTNEEGESLIKRRGSLKWAVSPVNSGGRKNIDQENYWG